MAVKKQLKQVKDDSDLIRIVNVEERQNKRLCMIIVLLIILLAISVVYIIYLHNDIGTEVITEETYDMSTENGNNNYVGGDNNGTIENH